MPAAERALCDSGDRRQVAASAKVGGLVRGAGRRMAAAKRALTDSADRRELATAASIDVLVADAGLGMAAAHASGELSGAIAHGLACTGNEPGGRNICEAR